MELILLIFGLAFLVTLLLPWVHQARIRALRDEVDLHQKEIGYLKQLLSKSDNTIFQDTPFRHSSMQTDTEILPQPLKQEMKREKTDDTKPYQNVKSRASLPRTSTADWAKKAQSRFEQNIATKLPVWIGAISLICAAFFLVKYSMELGWMQPVVRVSIGGLFGMALLFGGSWVVKRSHLANYERIAQGLVGAGLVALYFSVYAAMNLYGLLPPLFAFGGMAIITALAVILSLRHGQPIAVFGLLGGLFTPVLIESEVPNAAGLFVYLFLLFTAMFAVLMHKGWWVLALLAVVGVFGWSFLWFALMFTGADGFVLVVFAIAIMAIVLAGTGRQIARESIEAEDIMLVHGLNFTAFAGAVLTIIWLSLEMSLSLFDWSMLALIGAGVMVMAFFKPEIYQKPLWAVLGTSLVLYFLWSPSAPLIEAVIVVAMLCALYIGGAAFMMRRAHNPRFWASIQAVTGIFTFAISYLTLRADIPSAFMDQFGMFWGIISLILASATIFVTAQIQSHQTFDETVKNHVVAIYAFTASAFIAMGLAIELPWDYLPLAFAGQIAITAWIYQRTGIVFLKHIALILVFIFAGTHFEQIILFIQMTIDSLDGNLPRASILSQYVTDMPLIKLALPSVFIIGALWVFVRHGVVEARFFHIMFGAGLLLAMAAVYYLFGYGLYGDFELAFATQASFVERGVISAAAALAGFGLLMMRRKWNMSYLQPWAFALLILAASRHIYFDFFIHNPLMPRGQFVGDMIVFNGITLTYGIGALLWLWALRIEDIIKYQTLCKIMACVSMFAFLNFTVRHFFHGGDLSGDMGGNLIRDLRNGAMSAAELYSYSVLWLLSGIALLGFGIWKDNKDARMASLGFIMLAVLKVFLYDAAELEGLYRVFSFLGLGVSLIGLSFFYTRFVFSQTEKTS